MNHQRKKATGLSRKGKLTLPTMNSERFIACGMYAFNLPLQKAWQELFDHFSPVLDCDINLRRELDYRHGIAVLHHPALLFGQTCGYPLMTKLKDTLTPFCVPCFDVPGSEGKFYSSQLIVNRDSDLSSLAECEGKIAAINTIDSQSGMNVLRHEVAKLGGGQGFFGEVEFTGGHFNSLQAVAEGRADVASIDCVTYQLIADALPDLVARVKHIGFTAKASGLPFVIPNSVWTPTVAARTVEALQQAYSQTSQSARDCLHLAGFEAVNFDDYAGILEFESYALERGITMLN